MALGSIWPYASRRSHRSRRSELETCLRYEHLEARELLSVTPPTVVDVAVASTAWSSSFLDYLDNSNLGSKAYSIPIGSTAQSLNLPWENIDQIKITFSEDVHVDSADLAMSGVNTSYYEFDGFVYDAITHVATWTLADVIAADRLMLDLDADGLDPVTDLAGNLLDGEWVDNVTSGPSGNGTAGGDFEFTFNVVPGDVDQNTYVTFYDYVFVRARDGQDTNGANYTALHDIDGSGLIDLADWWSTYGYVGSTAPVGQPVGATNDAPTTSGISYLELEDPAVDEAISLYNVFEDAEDSDSQLTYEVVGNTDPTVLDNLSIDPATGDLNVSAAANVSGRTNVTIRATDSQGLSTETSFPIDAGRENLPPVITDYLAQEYPGNTWLFTGYVSDPDDDVAGWIVTFGGVFDYRATVDNNGYFEFAVILDPGTGWGYEWAQAWDPAGLSSNTPSRWIGVT
ncbi:MAG: hypothetical protein AAGD11_07645 [Planctomycetota bacterium]